MIATLDSTSSAVSVPKPSQSFCEVVIVDLSGLAPCHCAGRSVGRSHSAYQSIGAAVRVSLHPETLAPPPTLAIDYTKPVRILSAPDSPVKPEGADEVL